MDHLDFAKWRFSLEAEAPFPPSTVIDDIANQLISSGYRIIKQTSTNIEFDDEGNHSYNYRIKNLWMLEGGTFEVIRLDGKCVIKLTYFIDMFFRALFILLFLIVSLMVIYLDSWNSASIFLLTGILVQGIFQIFWSKKIARKLLLNL